MTGRRDDTDTGNRSGPTALLVGLAIAALLGVAAAGGSIVRSSATAVTAREAFPYALLGALAAAVVAAVVVLAMRAARPGAMRLRPAELLGVATVVMALGALLGAAFAPDTPGVDEVGRLTDDATEQRQAELDDLRDGDRDVRAAPIDRDGDGLADLDAEGREIVGVDVDGDGRFDGILQPCPPGTPVPEPRPGMTPIDVDCDGTIDDWIAFDPSALLRGDATLPAAPDTIAPEERAQRADDAAGDALGRSLIRILLALAAIALCAALVVWLVRLPDRDAADGTEGELPDDAHGDGGDEDDGEPPADLTDPLTASLDALLDEPDPRRAICAAYGQLLDGLAAIGLPRRPEEAPAEHVRRCVAAAGFDPGPMRQLVDVFTRARFSDHPIDESHRAVAVGALRAALDDAQRRRPRVAAVAGVVVDVVEVGS